MDYFDDYLSKHHATVSVNKYEEVIKHLPHFGIKNLDLISFLADYNLFITLFNQQKYKQIFLESIGSRLQSIYEDCTNNLVCVSVGEHNNLDFTETINDNNHVEHFTYKQKIGKGSFNTAYSYEKIEGDIKKRYIIKITNPNDIDGNGATDYVKKVHHLIISFYENLKHIILYILIRIYIPKKIKLIPKIIKIGHIQAPKNKGYIVVIMEYGGNFFKPTNWPIQQIETFIYSVYKGLELLNGLNIHFRHGDLKNTNILVSSTNKPIIIDFGFTEFELTPEIKFYGDYLLHNYYNEFNHLIDSNFNKLIDINTENYNNVSKYISVIKQYHNFEAAESILILNLGIEIIRNYCIQKRISKEQCLDLLNSTCDMILLIQSLRFDIGDSILNIFSFPITTPTIPAKENTTPATQIDTPSSPFKLLSSSPLLPPQVVHKSSENNSLPPLHVLYQTGTLVPESRVEQNKDIFLDGKISTLILQSNYSFRTNKDFHKQEIQLKIYTFDVLPYLQFFDLITPNELLSKFPYPIEHLRNTRKLFSTYRQKYLKYKKKYMDLKNNSK